MVDVAMQIRPARQDDASNIDLLIVQSIRLWTPYYSAAQIESSLTHLFGIDPQSLVAHSHYVAETRGALVGCCGWSQGRSLVDRDEFRDAPAQAEVRALFVHPQWLRRGIGGRLLRVCQTLAGDAGFTQMTAVATLPGASFYRHHGFAELEQRALRLPDGEFFPVVRMGKKLTKAVTTESMLCI